MPADPATATDSPPSVAAGPDLGPYAAADFRITDGRCDDCATIRQALWYFQDETIAVPKPGRPIARFLHSVRFDIDLREWLAARDPPRLDFPPLVWIGAPHVVRGTLNADATALATPRGTLRFALAPKIPLNRSYFDASSASFFAGRRLKVRGSLHDRMVVAHTLWPEELRVEIALPLRPLAADVPPALALRAKMREEPNGGATSPYTVETLWQRRGTSADLRGRAVLAFIVNGAQGDDDEAHAGHFALVTGRVQGDGAIGDWLVNNFYTLDAESEKGIIAAPVPLDHYLAELNAGQSWYRPSYMIVAALSSGRASALVQSALGRVYNQFYRHQLVYYHPTTNCTSISVDTLRALGWNVPARGPTSRLAAWLGFPWFLVKDRSLAKARFAFDYLCEDQTRLLPAAAGEEIGASLLALVGSSAPGDGLLAQMLARDVDALLFVRFPQFPSSRAWGDAPAASAWEYRTRIPSDPALVQTVPVPPRPFPRDLRDPDLLPPPRPPSAAATVVWSAVLLAALAGIAIAFVL